jgi:membrane-associated phospholipid phosphatase
MAESLTLVRPQPLTTYLSAAARTVSDMFSPAALAVPCLLLGVWASEVPGTYKFAILYFLVAVPLPLGYVVWLVKTGRVSDFHLPDRRDRRVPFLISIGSALLALVLLIYFEAPAAFIAPVVTALAETFVLFLITLVWQISIHTATTTGLVTFAVLAIGGGAVAFLLLVPLVMWARLYLGRHTLAQTVGGVCLGSAVFGALFLLRGLVW